MRAKCLCGAIEVNAPSKKMGLCHCSMCRHWSGGPMFAVHCKSDVEFSGQEPTRYQSSDWAERGFCSKCGTHLFYHLLPNNEYILPAGLFQDQEFEFTNEIFIDEKPSYYELKTPQSSSQRPKFLHSFSSLKNDFSLHKTSYNHQPN